MEQFQQQLQQQAHLAFNTFRQQAVTASQDLLKTVQADFDLSPLQKIVKSGADVNEIHALLTNKTVLKYAFWLVIANAVTVIAARQSIRGRNPFYVLLATFATIFFAPTLFPLITGNPITWIQSDAIVLTVFGVAVGTYLIGRFFLALFPFRLIASVIIAVASANVVAAGWKMGLAAFKSTSGAFLIAALDAAARPFALALEAYLVDGSLGNVKHVRSHLMGAIVYGAVLLNFNNEKLALIAAFAIIATGAIFNVLGIPINWFLPLEILLLGTSNPKTPKADAPKPDVQQVSGNKKR